MEIRYHKRFEKSYVNLRSKQKEATQDAIFRFRLDVFDQQLRNHALKGKWLGFRSIDVSWDLRIIFRELSDGRYELVELVEVGSHSQLY